jgi:hypothetical protein
VSDGGMYSCRSSHLGSYYHTATTAVPSPELLPWHQHLPQEAYTQSVRLNSPVRKKLGPELEQLMSLSNITTLAMRDPIVSSLLEANPGRSHQKVERTRDRIMHVTDGILDLLESDCV